MNGITTAETIDLIEAAHGELAPLDAPLGDPARIYRLPGAVGTIGFISPVSQPFCAFCNRIRLTADGKLRLCLLRERIVMLQRVERWCPEIERRWRF